MSWLYSLIRGLLSGSGDFLKAIFGMNEAAKTEVKHEAVPESLKPDDATVLRELGVRPVNRPPNKDGDSGSGAG